MSEFKGIAPEMIMLLAENRFNNSKIFYDEHKEEIKSGVTKPLYALISDLEPTLKKIDPEMCLIPSKMISRIRRDTRYTRDKSLYRENVWIMFMRHKKLWYHQPCMWFEMSPNGMNWGVGIYDCRPAVMERFRKKLDEKGEEFLKAADSATKVGARPSFTLYKKDKSEGKDQRLKLYYNAKELYFISPLYSLETLFDGNAEQQLEKAIKAYAPMYKFLMEITEEMLEEEGGITNA